jgi:Reverse transcriptase (RNA-dependent DNA polymerase)
VRPIYITKPIGSERALAGALGLSVEVLKDFAANASSKYSRFEIDKHDGTKRSICSPNHDLKIIQKRINRAVFGNVEYPDYLFGGIAERDYVKNARAHSGAKALISLDIANFYPKISAKWVSHIFKHFCKFPDPVVLLLTQLTTLDGFVPQGACTSSHIANLIFHDKEYRVVQELKSKRITYTRLLDDICISSPKRVFGRSEVTALINQVVALLKSKGFDLKSKKTRITSASNPENLMEVTGLWLNRGAPRVRTSERDDIRLEMQACELNSKLSRTSLDYHKEHERLSGRVSKLSYLDHPEAREYRSRLRKILPHFDEIEVRKTVHLVSTASRTNVTDRGKYAYIDWYYQLMHRISIIARTDSSLAAELRGRMHRCAPTATKESIIYGDAYRV